MFLQHYYQPLSQQKYRGLVEQITLSPIIDRESAGISMFRKSLAGTTAFVETGAVDTNGWIQIICFFTHQQVKNPQMAGRRDWAPQPVVIDLEDGFNWLPHTNIPAWNCELVYWSSELSILVAPIDRKGCDIHSRW